MVVEETRQLYETYLKASNHVGNMETVSFIACVKIVHFIMIQMLLLENYG